MKTPIALIINDPHLKEDNIDVVKSIFQQASDYAIKFGLKSVDCGGDIFNSRKSQSQLVLTTFVNILDQYHHDGIDLNSCVGNHDKTNYGGYESFLDPFQEHPAFNLYRSGGGRSINDIDLMYLSYFEDEMYIKEMQPLLASLKNAPSTVLLTHIGIDDAVMNNGTVIQGKRITANLFKPFALTLVGHFHDAQVLAEGKIKYTGACLQHDFSELTGKGCTILYSDLSTEIIPLKYPQYLKYEISPKEITASDIADIKKEKSESGDNIRIVLTGTESELKSFNKQILIDAGVSVQHKQNLINQEEIKQRVEPFSATSLLSEFEIFCKKNKLDLNAGMKYFNAGVLGTNKQTLELA